MTLSNLPSLTKKNQEFIHIATNQLIKDGKSDQEIKSLLEEILPTIIEHQKSGTTARNLFGPPSEWAASKSAAPSQEKQETVEYNENPWLMWLDSSLFMLAIIAGINGLMNLFNQGAQYGLVTLLVIGFGVGAGMYFMYHFVYREQAKTGKRPNLLKAILFLGVATLAWSAVFFLAALVPANLNPIPHPILTILICAIAFGIRYLLKKKYNIRNAMQPVQWSFNSISTVANLQATRCSRHRKCSGYPIHLRHNLHSISVWYEIYFIHPSCWPPKLGCSICSIFLCNTKVGHLDEHSYLIQATTAKLMKTPLTQFVEGIFANIVVNIAVFISMRMKDDAGRVISLIFIIFIFAFLGFEHVIANFSTFSLAFFANGGAVEGMTVMSVLINFLFSGLGNFVGGGILIGFLYSWLSNKSKLYVD